MIKIIVEDRMDDDILRYSFLIDRGEIKELKFSPEEQDKIFAANSGRLSAVVMADILTMIFKKIEEKKHPVQNWADGKRLEDFSTEDLNEMYIDHLVTDLQKRSVAKILDFLARYCGWERIQKYATNKILERIVS